MQKKIRNLIIGEGNYIESRGEFKQVMLSGQFALLGILLMLLYLAIDISFGNYSTLPVLITSMFLLGLSVFIHRQGDHCLANYFLLPTLNVTVYLIAASESPQTGIYVFFIVNAIAAFAVFNYRQRILSILFVAFTYVLFAFAYFVDFSILPRREYSSDVMLLNVIVNFTFALPAATMCIYLLITLNHHNDMELVQSNNKLTKANSELDRFVYSASHDLRAPLASVLGLINIAMQAKSLDEANQYLGMMKQRINTLDHFIKDITDYSRNNRLEVKREKVNLAEITTEIWESLKYVPEAANINFKLDIPETAFVNTDRNRLRIVMSNLLSNAIRYHDLQKQDQFIRVKHHVNGKIFYLKVEDNGQGIAHDHHTKVFDMFYRGHETSKGSGLGLYIVKETLLKLSGSIQLESAPGQGTTFTVKLPKA